ncbi:peptide ligase PGM1-related protein [Pseudomarimonas salicorniae]|uniref:Peptide ligase PGM1-related protein n=1 Tax=Pseudomarimonas salicorniae TaxID=2933270 RepID=A0ABT0GKT6_9GAMM|nr:peptide ligase PGM1-related protein [Lysobacter sp. CAU 1642]MCK7594992.1 peptide ligase PGM1-related protein [Lysobacter sp. CAU 1642]
MSSLFPATGAVDGPDWSAFERLQKRLAPLFEHVFADPAAPRGVVVVPGLSLDAEVLSKVKGVRFYEERMLSMLMLLRLPNTRVVFVTSTPLDPDIVDYYLGLLPGVPGQHARRRLTLLSAHDASPEPLTSKILARPRLLARIRDAIGDTRHAHLSVFNSSVDEARLACLLGIPMYACDPRLSRWGSKSGSREAFRRAGVALPAGHEDLADRRQLAEAILALRRDHPSLKRVVVKLEEGFSGDGNARLPLARLPDTADAARVDTALDAALEPEAEGMDGEAFLDKFRRMGGIVEAWIEGENKASPSVQMRINPLGGIELISTHDQQLGGRSGQVFLGSRFPAEARYRPALHEAAARVAQVLREEGVLGRFSIDFLHCAEAAEPMQAIEINLRKGGTTLPFQMLQFLTGGRYEPDPGAFITPLGARLCYVASDNLENPAYRSLTPTDLIDVLVQNGLHFDTLRQQGVVFNLIGALSEYGKLGLVSIAPGEKRAQKAFDEAVAILDRETGAVSGDKARA